jgi:hypothetical protein
MDVNDADFEDDGSLLRLMVAGEERICCSISQISLAVYRFSLQISGFRHVAEEVMQETFLSLIRAPQSIAVIVVQFCSPVLHGAPSRVEEPTEGEILWRLRILPSDRLHRSIPVLVSIER